MKRLSIASVLLLAGCATVSNGPMQRIYVDSEPRGAAVRLENCGAKATRRLVTPGVAWVSRRSTQCELILAVPNAAQQRVKLSRHVARSMEGYGTTWETIVDGETGSLDDFFAASFVAAVAIVPSFAVDAATGSMFELIPNKVFADFTKSDEEWRTQPH